MISALHILLFGAVTFAAQNLDSLSVEVGATDPGFTYRLADLDGNGQKDLLLPSRVYFQHKGAFSERMIAPVPSAGAPPACDIWNDTLYLRLPDKLQKVHWQGQAWAVLSEQPIAWPDPGGQLVLSMHAGPAGIRFERFLHDINLDGIPEILVPTERGLAVFSAGPDGSYIQAAELDVFPPLQLARVQGRQLWPDSDRAVTFPARSMNCRYNVNGNNVAVITKEDCPDPAAGTRARFRIRQFSVDAALQIVPGQTREVLTDPFPPHLQLVRLNDDSIADIGGGDWQTAQSAPLPTPIFETRASTDAGKTFRTLRVTGFRPNRSFIDFNRDGKVDIVTESTHLFNDGLRESLSRFCTSGQLRHEVNVYLQDASNQFGKKAGVTGVFDIELDSPPIRAGIMFNRYQSGGLFNLAGDFNADGLNDAIVHDRPGRIALYLGSPSGFESRPSALLPIDPASRFTVADYDGDGRDDLAVHWYAANEPSTQLMTKLYLAREDRK